MFLQYWVATHTEDRDCYSIIGRTKGEVLDQIAESGQPEMYEKPVCRVVEYRDAFDLLEKATDEGAGRSTLGEQK